jgi:hypothetical protein
VFNYRCIIGRRTRVLILTTIKARVGSIWLGFLLFLWAKLLVSHLVDLLEMLA